VQSRKICPSKWQKMIVSGEEFTAKSSRGRFKLTIPKNSSRKPLNLSSSSVNHVSITSPSLFIFITSSSPLFSTAVSSYRADNRAPSYKYKTVVLRTEQLGNPFSNEPLASFSSWLMSLFLFLTDACTAGNWYPRNEPPLRKENVAKTQLPSQGNPFPMRLPHPQNESSTRFLVLDWWLWYTLMSQKYKNTPLLRCNNVTR